MKLSLRDAADLLSVPENILSRAVKDGSLCAYKLNHEYVLNRSELLEWATAHGLAVPAQVWAEGGQRALSIADALERGGVLRVVGGDTPAAVLRSIASSLPLDDANDRDLVLDMLVARQAQCTTAVGAGIAFPHARSPIVLDVDDPLIVLAYLANPVDFGAHDGASVSIVFTFVTPTIRQHHRVLSRLAHLVHDERLRAQLSAHAGADVIIPLARELEADLDRAKRPGASAA